ncbi:heavy metal translocating P-type ATPase [Ascidiaceihabitans sp.]|uniref:heavy metal translocating P-type ATPase n=1 Tax=Ascidiaceihabitans sp. TaxID=1872644 RepID=UPI00329909A0
MAEAVRPMACPGCVAVPAQMPVVRPKAGDILLSLPAIHCMRCIRSAESALNAHPDVEIARVNLTLKRATITPKTDVGASALVDALDAAGIEAHELDPGAVASTAMDKAGRELLMRLAVAGFAAMNVMLLSVAVWSGASDATRDLFHWISAAITLPAVLFAGQPFYASAFRALRARRLNMDVPISLAILLAVGTSLYETALSGEHAYFDAALTLCFFLLAGRYLEFRTRAAARSAAQELTALEVPRALLMVDGTPVETDLVQIKVGDLVLVRPGGRLPVDGVVVEGQSELDRHLVTGETNPVVVAVGATVQAAEINMTGPLTVRATAVGQDTSLHQMAELVAIAESGRSRYTALADKAAGLYAPGVHILSVLAFAGWWLGTGDLRLALNIAAAVLIITCPCALGLAVPAVTTAAAGRLFRKGLLVKSPTAMERLATVDTVVFDKTGTLTTGQPRLVGWDAVPQGIQAVALRLADVSAHPLSKAISAQSGARADVADIVERSGEGISGRWNGETVRLGRGDISSDTAHTTAMLQAGGLNYQLAFEDDLRAGAKDLIAALQQSGLDVILLSGDAQGPVDDVSARLGITQAHARMRPEQKFDMIRDLQGQGARVLMVGDGLNDTVALTAADVSISPASALDAARSASDVVLLGQNLAPLAEAITTAKSATKRIKENFQIATIYNILAVPLAAAGFATPLIAALAMSSSSITVSLNALRVRS